MIGRSLGIAIAAILTGAGTGVSVASAQYGYVDDSSHIPPSPAPQASSRWSPFSGTPAAAVTSPPPSSSTTSAPPAYNLNRLSNHFQRAGRATSVPHSTLQAGGTTNTKASVGPYGVGGRRPDIPRTYADSPRKVTPAAGQRPATESVSQARFDETTDHGFMTPVPPAASDPPLNPLFPRSRPLPLGPGAHYPTDRVGPPTITGSHLGLPPGETATERSLRLMSAVGELERHVEGLEQRNAEQSQLIKHRDEQLLLTVREIKTARKDVLAARDELEHLRLQVKALQEKVRDAERDNAALMQTMAPLLQKLLDPDVAGLPSDEAQE